MSTERKTDIPVFTKWILIVLSILFSSGCWYLSNGLTGNYWYLLWIAPVPILLIAFQVKGWRSFVVAFVAYSLGRLNWFEYTLKVIPVPAAISFLLFFALIFALVIVLTRKIILTRPHWLSVFVFPVLWTSFEFIFFKLSPHGTVGSIAYTQLNFLPVVQIASVTGILGITFLVTLFPSSISGLVFYWKKMHVVIPGLIISAFMIVIALLFGELRIKSSPGDVGKMTIGLAVMDENYYDDKYYDHNKGSDVDREKHIVDQYLQQISTLAKQGAEVILLPEKIFMANSSLDTSVIALFAEASLNQHVTIMASYTKVKDTAKENAAMVISPEGKLLTDYIKVKLFEGEAMNGFMAGSKPGLFQLNNVHSGIAICKDLDFADYIKTYDVGFPEILFVPAFDFIDDGWLHSRMAIMRGVENGYAVVRTARAGRLTISDFTGKVSNEANSENGKPVTLIGNASILKVKTIYSRFGNWFGIFNLIAASGFCIFIFAKQNTPSL